MKKTIAFFVCFALLLAIIPASSFSAESVKKRPSYLFAIDAGHGGNDPGSTRCDGKYESNDTAKIANEVIKLLKEQGQRTMLINRNLKTQDRPAEANNANADFLISLHRDAVKNSPSTRGISVYTHEPTHRQRTEQPNKDYAPAEHRNKHQMDEKLVNNLKTNLTGATAMPFRGVYYGSASAPTWEDYYINRLSNMPSCIIEYGFGTNAADNQIFDTQYKILALATVKALLATVDLSYIGPFANAGKTIAQFQNEWYYVVDGVVAWDYTGDFTVNNKIYFIENGYVKNRAGGKTGQCDWQLDSTELSVSGKGAMGNYTASSAPPWGNMPLTAELTDGVTAIGNYAFYNAALVEVSIPKTVTKIGANAFDGCASLERVLFYGVKSEWEQIEKSTGNSVLDTAQILYICDINGHQYDFVCDSECNVCGEKREVTHTYSGICDVSCDVCGEVRETVPHTYSGDCDKICDVCGSIRQTETAHIFGDSEFCTVCGSRKYIVGDIDGDEEITDWDGVMLARYLAGWKVEIASPEALDIDGDEEVTDWDGVLLDRYLAGWNVSIG